MEYNEALHVYQQGLTLWSERAKKYPQDVRPSQGMAGIYADLSRWHIVLASQKSELKIKDQHQKKS